MQMGNGENFYEIAFRESAECEEGGGFPEGGEEKKTKSDGPVVGGFVVAEDCLQCGRVEDSEHAPADFIGEGGADPWPGRDRCMFVDSVRPEIVVHLLKKFHLQFRNEFFIHVGKEAQ